MKPRPIPRKGMERRDLQDVKFSRLAVAYRGGVWLCVLLVFLTSFVAVAHFHPTNSESPDHSCSLCALAHAGITVNNVVQTAPILAPSILAKTPAITSPSFLVVAFYYIRPPPQA
jgi:hypothetical protein